jgi:general stress protein YciG
MSFDIVLMAIVLGGIGLSAAYVRAEYIHWRERGDAERRRETALRELHTARLSEQQSATLLPSVFKLQGFGENEAANPEDAANIGRRGPARTTSPRTYPFMERRKHDKQRATQ